MELVRKELTKEESNKFYKDVDLCNELYFDLINEEKKKNLYQCSCKRCGSVFMYSCSDIGRDFYQNNVVSCPVCETSITVNNLSRALSAAEEAARNNEKYAKMKAELTDYANIHRISVSLH